MTVIQQSPPPRRHGCLWGCLGALAVVLLPFLFAAGYTAWFWLDGYRRDPTLRAVVELVRGDGMAEQALGRDIHITGVEASAMSYMWGRQSGAYVVTLQGSKGRGTLQVIADDRSGRLNIQRMILDGPDSRRYDLLHHLVQPGSNPTTSI
jgi:hypothetical protein